MSKKVKKLSLFIAPVFALIAGITVCSETNAATEHVCYCQMTEPSGNKVCIHLTPNYIGGAPTTSCRDRCQNISGYTYVGAITETIETVVAEKCKSGWSQTVIQR